MEGTDVESAKDYREAYRRMPDYQIMQIASEGGLVPEAVQALNEELAARGASTQDINQHVEYVAHQKLLQRVGNNILYVPHGVGIAFRGKRFSSIEDERLGIELRTRWIILFWIPVIPIGSYRIIWGTSSSTFWGRGKSFQIVSEEKLDLQQVLTIWSIPVVILLFAFVMSRF